MLGSRETFVDYTMPLGLHHLIGGDHYAPMPENADPRRADWSAIYYHRADAAGIGFDRTTRGSNAVGQYRSPLRERWNDPATCPENLLLWFHRLPWDYRLASGGTLWDGAGPPLPPGRRRGRVDGGALGIAARQGRRTALPGRAREAAPRRPPTPPRGATSACATSSSSAGGRGEGPGRDGHGKQRSAAAGGGEGRLRDGRRRDELLLPVDDPLPDPLLHRHRRALRRGRGHHVPGAAARRRGLRPGDRRAVGSDPHAVGELPPLGAVDGRAVRAWSSGWCT